jgi:hypothetical protein
MSESANRLALGAFETWEQASRALIDCAGAGVGSARVIVIALSSVFNEAGACRRTFELPFREADERVRCSSRFLARQFGSEALGRIRFEDALRAWLAPRQAVRIVSYVRQRKIVIAVHIRKPGEERSVGLVLLTSSSTPVEFHDLRPGGAHAVN